MYFKYLIGNTYFFYFLTFFETFGRWRPNIAKRTLLLWKRLNSQAVIKSAASAANLITAWKFSSVLGPNESQVLGGKHCQNLHIFTICGCTNTYLEASSELHCGSGVTPPGLPQFGTSFAKRYDHLSVYAGPALCPSLQISWAALLRWAISWQNNLPKIANTIMWLSHWNIMFGHF